MQTGRPAARCGDSRIVSPRVHEGKRKAGAGEQDGAHVTSNVLPAHLSNTCPSPESKSVKGGGRRSEVGGWKFHFKMFWKKKENGGDGVRGDERYGKDGEISKKGRGGQREGEGAMGLNS